jgi:ParB-like chromosome segregation protein Spo0J
MDAQTFKNLPVSKRIEEIELRLELGETGPEIKENLELSRYELSHLKRLSKRLTPEARKLISRNNLAEGHARALARLPAKMQESLLREALHRRWSVRKIERRVKDLLEGREPEPDDSYYEQLATHISDTIGHPVKVCPDKTNPSKGQIIITYLGFDAFDSVMERLNVELNTE